MLPAPVENSLGARSAGESGNKRNEGRVIIRRQVSIVTETSARSGKEATYYHLSVEVNPKEDSTVCQKQYAAIRSRWGNTFLFSNQSTELDVRARLHLGERRGNVGRGGVHTDPSFNDRASIATLLLHCA